jgi:hypothetical protein
MLLYVIEKILPTMPKHKFENLKNLGSWSNYRGSLLDDKESVSSKIMITFFTKNKGIVTGHVTSHDAVEYESRLPYAN